MTAVVVSVVVVVVVSSETESSSAHAVTSEPAASPAASAPRADMENLREVTSVPAFAKRLGPSAQSTGLYPTPRGLNHPVSGTKIGTKASTMNLCRR